MKFQLQFLRSMRARVQSHCSLCCCLMLVVWKWIGQLGATKPRGEYIVYIYCCSMLRRPVLAVLHTFWLHSLFFFLIYGVVLFFYRVNNKIINIGMIYQWHIAACICAVKIFFIFYFLIIVNRDDKRCCWLLDIFLLLLTPLSFIVLIIVEYIFSKML